MKKEKKVFILTASLNLCDDINKGARELESYLNDGWEILSNTTMGGGSEAKFANVIILER